MKIPSKTVPIMGTLNIVLLIAGSVSTLTSLSGNPIPGDVFHEYTWITPDKPENSAFLRVGGRFDYRIQIPVFDNGDYRDGNIRMPFDVDLDHAIKAEIEVQKLLCHDGTTGLTIILNEHHRFQLPEATHIPEPQSDYMHFFAPEVKVPLEALNTGNDNWFSFTVDQTHLWGWPQNLVYGVTLRVYYDPLKVAPCPARIKDLPSSSIQNLQPISIAAKDPSAIKNVDFLARYEDIDFGGDGVYFKWHCYRFREELKGHIGSTQKAPFEVVWDTGWIPDQKGPIEISAQVTTSDYTYFLEPIQAKGFSQSHHIELCKPYAQPTKWVTRNGAFDSYFRVEGDLAKASDARLLFRTWSPGYLNGIFLNDQVIFTREGPKYAYAEHLIENIDLDFIYPGVNKISTGMTPRHLGEMVHGAEILWPGVMTLVRYDPEHQAPEWKQFPKEPTKSDFDAAFQGFWNTQGLMILVTVTDDSQTAEDAVDIFIRSNPMQLRGSRNPDEANHLFRIPLKDGPVEHFRASVQQPPVTAEHVQKHIKSNGSYSNVFLLIRWEELELQATAITNPDSSIQLGFECSVKDQDPDQAHPDHLTWNVSDRVPGNWIESETWGILQLERPANSGNTNAHPSTDWTLLDLSPKPKVVTFDYLDIAFEDFVATLAAQPTMEPISNWLPL